MLKETHNNNNSKNLKPPLPVIIDTNFIYFTIRNKIDLFHELLECLCTLYIPVITNCVTMELQKLGVRFRLALKYSKDERIIKMECFHSNKIIYADNCIYHTVKSLKIFIVATCDKDLKRRIRGLSFVPIISIRKKKFYLENPNQIL